MVGGLEKKAGHAIDQTVAPRPMQLSPEGGEERERSRGGRVEKSMGAPRTGRPNPASDYKDSSGIGTGLRKTAIEQGRNS